jgi:hypothetical protein
MSGLLPVALYGLEVPAGEIMIPAAAEFPATVSGFYHPSVTIARRRVLGGGIRI